MKPAQKGLTYALALLFAVCNINPSSAFISDTGIVPWSTTASGNRTANGQSVTLTWSIVPDSTTTISDGQQSLGGSDLVAFLNDTLGGDPNQTDHQQQPWFPTLSNAFERWSELSGINYVYEPNDDGGNNRTRRGVLGVRGDVRLGGASIDGGGGTLAFNFFPQSGGDMVLDTDDTGIFGNAGNNFVRFRNTVAHELGHGLNLDHVLSSTDNLLLNPSINPFFDGPQLDEVRAVHFFYGDHYEETNQGTGNGTPALATGLGSLGIGETLAIGTSANIPDQRVVASAVDFVSISNINDIDAYSFTVSERSSLSAILTPHGGVFTQSSENGSPTAFDANARVDLSLEILNSDGTRVLGLSDDAVAGDAESLSFLVQPGEYLARIAGGDNSIQLYELELALGPPPGDFNRDGFVDAADFTVWRDALGTSVSPGSTADGDSNGLIDTADYQVWSDNFGVDYTLTNSNLALSVPEPDITAWMIFAVMIALPFRRNGRR